MWSEPRRTHPAGVLFYTLRHVGAVFTSTLGFLFAVVSVRADPRVGFGVLFAVVALILAAVGSVVLGLLQWRRFTFMIDDGTLRVEQGLVIRKSTRLTPERIQSIDTKANIVFRILGLVTVDIHTAGRGQAPEVSIPALTEEEARDLAEALRARRVTVSVSMPATMEDVSADGESAEAGAMSPRTGPTWSLSATELAIVSATSNGGPLVMAALGPVIAATATAVLPGSPVVGAGAVGGFVVVGMAVLGLVSLSVFAWLTGGVATALRYWDFATTRTDGEVRVEQGLLQRNTRNVPLDRVQAVRLIEGPLRQMIGRVTVGVDSAGIATGSEFGPTVLHPMLTKPEARRFCDLMVPGHDAPSLVPLPERSRRRYVIRAVALPLLVFVPVAVLVPFGWLLLLLPMGAAGWALLAFADAAWGRNDDVLAMRWRSVGRTTALVRRARIQSIAVSQHPLQRIAGLASVSVRVAASPATAVFTIRHMEQTDAETLLDWVSHGRRRVPVQGRRAGREHGIVT